MAKSNFIVRGGADFSGIKKGLDQTQKWLASFQSNISRSLKVAGTGIKKGLDQTQKRLASFQSNISRSLKVAGAVLGGLAVGKLVKDSTAMAMGVESAIDNIGRNMGSSSAAFNKWAETQSKAFGMAKADAYKYGSTFSNLLSSFSGSTKQTADSTQELMKAAAVISSKTGRSYEDTAERIRSGMLGSTEAIEDLGVYTNVSMIESTDAFKKFANGKSWAQLDFQVQQQIRLAAILEQTYARYGDTLADTTQTRQAMFIASLKNIQLNLGQAFLPIYNAVLPVLTALSNKIEAVTSKLKYFTQAIFGKAVAGPVAKTEEQAAAIAGVGDAAETAGKKAAAAGKKAKGSVAGFDEINSLADPSDSSGSGESSSGAAIAEPVTDIEVGEDTSVSSDFESAISAMKNRIGEIKSYIDTYLAPPFQEAIELIKPKIGEFQSILAGVWADIGAHGAPLKNWFMSDFTPFLQNVIKSMGIVVSGLFDSFNMVFSDIWKRAVYPTLTNFISVGLPVLTDFLNKAVSLFTVLFEEVKKIFDMIWSEAVAPALSLVTKIWIDTVNVIAATWNEYGNPIFEGIKTAFTLVGELLRTVWETTLKPVFDTFMETVDWLWSKHLKPLLSNVTSLVAEFIVCALKIINEFILPLVKEFVERFGPPIAVVFGTIVSVLGTFLAVAADVIGAVITVLKGLIQFITGVLTGDWSKAWEGIVNIFKGIFEGIGGIVHGVVNIVIDLINGMIQAVTVGLNYVIDKLNSIQISIPDWVPDIGGRTFGINIDKITAPTIPKLAKGGITNGPTLAMIGDNPGGREVVSPLDDLTNMIASAVGSAMMGAMQFSGAEPERGDGDIIINLNDRELARASLKSLNKEATLLGYKPILQTI
ncbi:hypothetical protein Ami103574_04485 [Aminipila butyrica]|uniref:Phage-related protein n=1 Tax=Aminipila butyrica TaxID=433296 RepID=A0A858BUK1_9FIRM|nr:hypothetical protein [Aminipila butyrica]QIB68620.1 hypothetical protein Ami103574_04485 [Aminipila butyrica]